MFQCIHNAITTTASEEHFAEISKIEGMCLGPLRVYTCYTSPH
jgi:hypothetical protein